MVKGKTNHANPNVRNEPTIHNDSTCIYFWFKEFVTRATSTWHSGFTTFTLVLWSQFSSLLSGAFPSGLLAFVLNLTARSYTFHPCHLTMAPRLADSRTGQKTLRSFRDSVLLYFKVSQFKFYRFSRRI